MGFRSGLMEINRQRAKEGKKPTSAAGIRTQFNPGGREHTAAQKEA